MSAAARRWGLALAGTVLSLVLAWLVFRPAPVVEAPPPNPLPAAVAAAPPVAPTSAAPAVASSAPALTRIDPQLEICRNPKLGKQSIETLTSEASPLERYLNRQGEDLRNAAIAALSREGSSEEQRLAAHLLRGDPDAAARLATRSDNPRVYSMAWRVCQSAPSADCATLNLERWAQLAPDNAAPWLEMLAAAQRRGDRSQAIEAMHRAGLASEMDIGWGWLTAQTMAALPADPPEGGLLVLLTELMGRQAALVDSHGRALMQQCSERAIADSNTRQQCERVAQLMMSRGQTVASVGIGARLGERLALPASQMPVSMSQVNVVDQTLSGRFMASMARPDACAGAREFIDTVRAVTRLGEWPAMQAAMQRR